MKIPRNRREVKQIYGDFSYTEREGRHISIDKEWVKENIARFELHTGKTVRLHKLIGDEFVRLFKEACETSGYTPKSVQTFVPRHFNKDDDSPLSYHSWGIAIDFDPQDNPKGGVRKDGSPSLMRQNPLFIKIFEIAGWRWGGSWNMKDDMHFQRKK
jgi:hypothetical protein